MRRPDQRKMDLLYLHLEPTERARLLARLAREQNTEELQRLRTWVPFDQLGAYRRALNLLCRLISPLHQILRGLLYGAERDVLALGYVVQRWRERRLLQLQMASLWDLVGYPITEREYCAVIEAERQEMLSLDEFAQYVSESFTADDTALRAEVLTALCALPEDAPDEDVAHAIRAVVDQAVARGELPAPVRRRQRRALPWGTLSDWLEPERAGAYEPLPPDAVIPAVRILGGFGARWHVRPDAEGEAVRAERERIIARLAAVAGVSSETLLDAHVPSGKAEQERAERQAQAAWPWPREEALRGAMLAIAERHAEVRSEVQAITAAIETIQREDFGGEDPLLAHVRNLLTDATAEVRAFAEGWTAIGELVSEQSSATEPWLPVPALEPERQDELNAQLLEYLRQEE